MKTILLSTGLGLLLGLSAGSIRSLRAQTPPLLEAHPFDQFVGITVTGTVSAAYAIQATTNLADPNAWVMLTNVALPASPWVFIDYESPGIARRFYRAVGMNTNTPPETNAPSGLALIPAGSFRMGDTFGEGDSDERPAHTVYVNVFYMDRTEVTKALWDEVYQWAVSHGYRFEFGAAGKAASHPAQSMTWYDAVKWCNARSEKEGRAPAYYTSAAQTAVYRTGQVDVQNGWVKWTAGYRLPTEAEWEKAARGGLSGRRFPWGDTITHSQANYYSHWDGGRPAYSYDVNPTEGYPPAYDDGVFPYTSPVGSFAPNAYGLYDMAGNVWEWCWDWYGSYSSAAQNDPRGPASGSYRVFRGGSWYDFAFYCRTTYRYYFPSNWDSRFGFRSVLPSGQQ